MNVNRRTQADRSAATRAALIAAARRLFGERGYAAVGTEEIVREAGVTRGALYHQFSDKQALFAAVLEAVEQEVLDSVVARATAQQGGPLAMLRGAVTAWLDACERPDVQRIVLLDAPGIVGWKAWQEMGELYSLGETMALLQAGIDAGVVASQPVRALALVLIGALDQAALYVARAEDREAARAEMDAVLDRLVAGLQAPE